MVSFSEEPCPSSKKDRPCVLKIKATTLIGNGQRRVIRGCVRCKEMTTYTENIENMECPTSKNGKHQWVKTKNLHFRQFKRYQEIHDEETCPCCGSIQIREYKRDIGYNPHRKR